MRRPGTRRWAAAPTGAHRPPSPSTWTLLLPRKCPAAAGACLGEFEAGESMKVMPVACRCFTEIEALVERSASARFTVAMVSFQSPASCALGYFKGKGVARSGSVFVNDVQWRSG